VRNNFVAAALIGAAIAAAPVGGQTPATPVGASGGQGRGGGGRNGANARGALATFPAQQRPPGDPVLIERGKTLYAANCQTCHGDDLRGATGGTSLLRSQILLSDQDGELIQPLLQVPHPQGGRQINLAAADLKATATFIHSIIATEKGQGAPPAPGVAAPGALVGDAVAGKVYFDAHCASCHSITGDLQAYGAKYPDAKTMQNRWVSGGGGRGGRGGGAAPDARTVMVAVSLPTGDKVEGPMLLLDDFIVSLTQPDGTIRTFTRDGDIPKVELKDPMQGHKTLLSVLTNKDMHDVTAYLVSLQ
jgi:cytochrome c oxidase cbb3-type subunit 3